MSRSRNKPISSGVTAQNACQSSLAVTSNFKGFSCLTFDLCRLQTLKRFQPNIQTTEESWQIQKLNFIVEALKREELVRATLMHPRVLRFGNTYYLCQVDLMPSGGFSSKVRVLPGMRMWAETEMTFYVKQLAEHDQEALHIQLLCKSTKKPPSAALAVSQAPIPFLLLYLNHTVHRQAKKNIVPLDSTRSGSLLRKPRQAETVGIKLPKIASQIGQSRNYCSLHPFWVSFHQLGWEHWIIAPHRYNPGFCKGDCPRILYSEYNSPNHAIIQNYINQVVNGNIPRPSCVPYSYGRISVLMIEHGGNILYKEYENMMAETCTCR
ncbi:bone morphogenetic protein 15-like [Hyperolius riggenbachi]|uniref:bone morphogenetic protein 15-like n=1 Tax=Hyperolius riggenbachi TaxID=752182 RepID=UPI0035A2E92B